MPAIWIVVIVALWGVVLIETGLLLAVLRGLGQLRLQNSPSTRSSSPYDSTGLALGDQPPPFVAQDYAGNPVKFDGSFGQSGIIAFISPGCSACATTIEALNEVLQTESELNVWVIGGDDRQLNHTYAQEHSAQTTIMTPPPNLVMGLYRITAIPFVYIVDESNTVRAKGVVNRGDTLQHLLSQARGSAAPMSVSTR